MPKQALGRRLQERERERERERETETSYRPPPPKDLFHQLISRLAIEPGTDIEGDHCVRIIVPAEGLASALHQCPSSLRPHLLVAQGLIH